VVECLPSKQEALSSILQYQQKKEGEGEGEEEQEEEEEEVH
jgi:hypothetical protein